MNGQVTRSTTLRRSAAQWGRVSHGSDASGGDQRRASYQVADRWKVFATGLRSGGERRCRRAFGDTDRERLELCGTLLSPAGWALDWVHTKRQDASWPDTTAAQTLAPDGTPAQTSKTPGNIAGLAVRHSWTPAARAATGRADGGARTFSIAVKRAAALPAIIANQLERRRISQPAARDPRALETDGKHRQRISPPARSMRSVRASNHLRLTAPSSSCVDPSAPPATPGASPRRQRPSVRDHLWRPGEKPS